MAQKYVLGPNAARAVNALIHGNGEVSRRQNLDPAIAVDSEYVAPFTVQWAASADSEGAWIIWLPGEEIVSYDGTSIDPASGLEDAGGEYPEGWYVLEDSMLDRDEGGKLYLNIDGSASTCTFAASATSGDETVSVVICEAEVDSDTSARSVRQYVTSAVVVAAGSGGSQEYGCDERSVSRIAREGSDSTEGSTGNYFYIKGFGKFTARGYADAIGTYQAPTTSTVELDGDATSFSVITRSGNSSSADSNFIGFNKLQFKSKAGSEPFKYVKSTSGSGSSTVTTHKLENCKFYWQGVLKELADFDVSGIIGSGTVYLSGTQAAATSSTPEPEWSWALGTTAAEAPEGGKVLNYKLYDFASSKVSIDYRTTFLALEDHTQKAYLEVAQPDPDCSITVDATGTNGRLIITGENDLCVDINIADFVSSTAEDECSTGRIGIHTLTWYDQSGVGQKVHFLGCGDLLMPFIQQLYLEAGSGIRITFEDDTYTITNTRTGGGGEGGGGGTSGVTDVRNVVSSVSYDESTHTLNMQLEHWHFTNGLLKSIEVDQALTTITTAVEET